MLAAESVITDVTTWDASAWIAAIAALIALGALVTAGLARKDSHQSATATTSAAGSAERSATAAERSAMTGEAAVRASQRSADAAERSATSGETSAEASQRSAEVAARALALQERDAQLQAADRHEAAGPQFTVVGGAAIVDDDLTARVELQMEGGPGELEMELRATGVAWCDGLSSTGAEPSGVVLQMAREPGAVITVVAHLSGRPWVDEHPEILPILVTAQTQDLRQQWVRRVPVPVVPPPVPQFSFMA